MRPDMLVVEMTPYIPATDTGPTLPNLQRTVPRGKARKSVVVEGGYVIVYCSKESHLETPMRKDSNMSSWRKH